MGLRFFNTYSRQTEDFAPLDAAGRTVKIYTCGPTVYSYAHIGNFRAYIFEDLLQRHLEARGFTVNRVMNLTDVDDKTIRGCRQAGVALSEFTAPFKRAFFEDLQMLRIEPAASYPEATAPAYIARMVEMIGILVERGYAYQADDRSVYYRINQFPAYGKLAHLDLEQLRPSGRIQSDEYDKENLGDFALWKAWDQEDGDVAWPSPWGRGRPGWHIECSAMAGALLGAQIDIHCGGVDNIFPHHEAEIAQTEAVTGERFVRYWMHCAHLMVEGQKMSKSLGNFYTLRDVLAKGHTGREIRYALLRVNYGLPLNFTFDGMADAREALRRLDEWRARIEDHAATATAPEPHPLADHERFEQALDDDLNISGALGQVFEIVRESNRALDSGQLTPGHARRLLDWWARVNRTLALEPEGAGDVLPEEVSGLLIQRAEARAAKDWKRSDEVRAAIAALGWSVKDTKDGPKTTPLRA
jgi:cysteinyl-tRNA synthetase